MAKYIIADASIDTASRIIAVGASTRRVSPKSMAVLEMLIAAEGDVVSRDLIMDRVWSNVTVGEEVLTQAVRDLRRAFCDEASAPRFIATVPKSGYRLAQRASSAMDKSLITAAEAPGALYSVFSYMDGCAAFLRGGRSNIRSSIDLFKQTIASDPLHASANAWLSIAMMYEQLYYGRGDEAKLREVSNEAVAHASHSIDLNRSAPDGYAARGYVFALSGEYEQAITNFCAAMRLGPDAFFPTLVFGRIVFGYGDYDSAARLLGHAAYLNGDEFQPAMLTANAAGAAGDAKLSAAALDQARMRIQNRLQLEPNDLRARIADAYCEIKANGFDRAAPKIDLLKDEFDPLTYYIVCALAQAGEIDAALDRFEAIIDNGWADPLFLRSDPDLDPLRNEPRFRRIAGAFIAA